MPQFVLELVAKFHPAKKCVRGSGEPRRVDQVCLVERVGPIDRVVVGSQRQRVGRADRGARVDVLVRLVVAAREQVVAQRQSGREAMLERDGAAVDAAARVVLLRRSEQL